jgi:hypothetical protein
VEGESTLQQNLWRAGLATIVLTGIAVLAPATPVQALVV